jgi:hypothetical protein
VKSEFTINGAHIENVLSKRQVMRSNRVGATNKIKDLRPAQVLFVFVNVSLVMTRAEEVEP